MRKPGRSSEIPPPLELECLKALWRLGDGSVKDVREVITENRNLAYTTVMTVLERLARRGAVQRRKAGRAFVYSALLDKEQARQLALKEMLDTYFGGSLDALREYVGTHREALSEPPPPQEAGNAPIAVEELDTTLL